MLPSDGTYPSDTARFNPIQQSEFLPEWHQDLCTQCGACSMACPQGSLRIKAYEDSYSKSAPSNFKSVKSVETDWEIDLLNYTIQINPEQCNGCHNCVDACSVKALTMINKSSVIESEKQNWEHFESIPEFDREKN